MERVATFEWEAESLHYVSEGDGSAVVLLHGLGGRINNWLLQRRHLSATHRVLSLDLPGHGHSTGRSVRFTDYWRAIEAMLDHAGVTSASLCGLAIGARAGLAFAARRPERVNGVVVVNTVLHLEPEDHAERVAIYDLLLEKDGARQWADALLVLMGVDDHPAIVRGFRKSTEEFDPLHIRRIFLEQDAYDQQSELKLISCPVLVVRGANDRLVPAYSADHFRAGLTNSELAVLDSGHLPYLEIPSEFNCCLSEFLTRQRI